LNVQKPVHSDTNDTIGNQDEVGLNE